MKEKYDARRHCLQYSTVLTVAKDTGTQVNYIKSNTLARPSREYSSREVTSILADWYPHIAYHAEKTGG